MFYRIIRKLHRFNFQPPFLQLSLEPVFLLMVKQDLNKIINVLRTSGSRTTD